jgi:hypothetical protein
MAQKNTGNYRIAWQSTCTKKKGHGDYVFHSREDAQAKVSYLNKEFPFIHHWVEKNEKENKMKEELTTEQKMLTAVIKLWTETQDQASKHSYGSEHWIFYKTKASALLDAITSLEMLSNLTSEQNKICWLAAEMEVFGCIR